MNPGLNHMLEAYIQDNSNTPDILALGKYNTVPLFVYGTERYKYSCHRSLNGASRIGQGHTTNPSYQMLLIHENGVQGVYPLIQNKIGDPNTGRVYGEIYEVSVKTLMDLDTMYDLSSKHWRRVPHMIRYWPYSEKDKRPEARTKLAALCWLYEGGSPYWDTLEKRKEASILYPVSTNMGMQHLSFMYTDDKPNRDLMAESRVF